jgi:ferredoxin-NADP reductase
MTSLKLLLWIAGSIALQLAIYLGIGFFRHWQAYSALRNKINDPDSEAIPDETDMAPVAWSGWRAFRVTHKVMEDAAQSVCSFELVPLDGLALPPFLPGQFLTFSQDIPNAKGSIEPIVRCYSLSDAPNPDHYRVSIKRVAAPLDSAWPPGRSSGFLHHHVMVGSLLQVRPPAGHFYLDRSDAPVVLIAGGIGITPLLSMLNWSLAHQAGREVWLFYAVRHSRELVMESHLQALAEKHSNFHLHVCLSKPLPQDLDDPRKQRHGRVDVTLLRLLLPIKPYHFYICGPTPMLQSIVPALEDWGVPDAHIHFEAFGPASVARRNTHLSAVPSGQDSNIVVTFAKSGKQLAWPGGAGNLLDFAEANGISVSSGCRAGSCGTCQTTIAAGEVAYRQLPDFDPEPGSCLMCVCAPKTSVTLEA